MAGTQHFQTQHRTVVGTSENLQQENLESYWKAIGPSRSTLLESKDSYPNCVSKMGKKKRKEERKKRTVILFRALGGIKWEHIHKCPVWLPRCIRCSIMLAKFKYWQFYWENLGLFEVMSVLLAPAASRNYRDIAPEISSIINWDKHWPIKFSNFANVVEFLSWFGYNSLSLGYLAQLVGG